MPQFGRSRRNKFGNQRTVVDGISFASKREARRYQELLLLKKAKQITDLRLQVRFKLVQEVTYVADFEYYDVATGSRIVEDAKGFKTEVYKRKKKLMKVQHGIEIKEV